MEELLQLCNRLPPRSKAVGMKLSLHCERGQFIEGRVGGGKFLVLVFFLLLLLLAEVLLWLTFSLLGLTFLFVEGSG